MNKRKLLAIQIAMACITVIVISAELMDLYKNIKINSELNKEKTEVVKTLDNLKETKEDLFEEKEKLEDPNYLENIIKGKYHFVGEDQQLFILPEIKD